MSKRWRRLILGFFILFMAIHIIGYIISKTVIVNTEPYRAAKNFIVSNQEINEKIGHVKSVSPSLFAGWSLRYSGPRSNAEFELSVEGTISKGKVYIKLEKAEGLWKVTKANFISFSDSVAHSLKLI